MYVCVCNRVTDAQIREACESGARSIHCLKARLNVATNCGRCEDCAKQVIQETQMGYLEPAMAPS